MFITIETEFKNEQEISNAFKEIAKQIDNGFTSGRGSIIWEINKS